MFGKQVEESVGLVWLSLDRNGYKPKDTMILGLLPVLFT